MSIIRFEGQLYRATKDRRNRFLPNYPSNDNEVISELDEAKSNFSFVWSGKFKSKSRYSNGSWIVLYAADSNTTAIAECVYHLYKKHGPEFKLGENIPLNLVQYLLDFSGNIYQLMKAQYDFEKLVAPNYDHCQVIAQQIKDSACALQAPSARQNDGVCYPIFNKNSIVGIPEAWSVNVQLENGSNKFTVLSQGNKFAIEIHSVYEQIEKAK